MKPINPDVLNPSSLSAELAARYKTDGMLAYVELVQRKEKELGCDVLTHQKWFVLHLTISSSPILIICSPALGVARITSIASSLPFLLAHRVPRPSAKIPLSIHSEQCCILNISTIISFHHWCRPATEIFVLQAQGVNSM